MLSTVGEKGEKKWICKVSACIHTEPLWKVENKTGCLPGGQLVSKGIGVRRRLFMEYSCTLQLYVLINVLLGKHNFLNFLKILYG